MKIEISKKLLKFSGWQWLNLSKRILDMLTTAWAWFHFQFDLKIAHGC